MNIRKGSEKAITNEDLAEKMERLIETAVVRLDGKIDNLTGILISVDDWLDKKIDNLAEMLVDVKDELSNKIEAEVGILATATKKGFDEVHEKFRLVDVRFDGMDRRLDKVEDRLDGVEYQLGKIEGRLEHIEDNHGIVSQYWKDK